MGEKYKAPDILAIVAKGGLGAIPYVGPLAAEIIGGIIPNQRLDRLEDTVKRLEAMLDEDGVASFKSKMDDPDFIDLFEEAMLQAARALTDERRENIARLLKNGMLDEERSHQSKRRMLEFFERINDTEIIILMAQAYDPKSESEFWKKHEDILYPPQSTIGLPLEPSEVESTMMSKVYIQNLVNLGLVSRSSLGAWSEEGDADPSNVKLTTFGWQMVKYLADSDEV